MKLLGVGAALLKDLLLPGTTWFKFYEYYNILNFFFTITKFTLAVHVLDKSGRENFSFQHASMVLAIFILVVFQVLEDFNMTHLPTLPDPNS